MRKKIIGQGKIGAVFLISIMAFAAIGVGYAHWQETLTISGVMTTDDIYPYFFMGASNDPGVPGSMDPVDCGHWYYDEYDECWFWDGGLRDKNVGRTDVIVSENDQILDVEVNDAYPCYYSHVFFGMKNRGSAPVLINSIQLLEVSYEGNIIPVNPPVDLIPGQWWGVNINEETGKAKVHLDVNNAKDDFSLMLTGDDMIINTQLDPQGWGEDGVVGQHMQNPGEYRDILYGDLCIHFENGCLQETTYDFIIGINFYNWPEFNPGVIPAQTPNTVESGTMHFEGALADMDDGVLTGTIPMTDDGIYGGGYDVYAEQGGEAYVQGYYGTGPWNGPSGLDTYVVGYFGEPHDAFCPVSVSQFV